MLEPAKTTAKVSRPPETAPSLYARLCSFENLLRAYRDAARGKRSHPDVATFDYHLEGHLIRLRDQLRQHTYHPGPYRRFTLADPKPRLISAAPFRDRLVHHALCNIIEPLFERRFISDSYSRHDGDQRPIQPGARRMSRSVVRHSCADVGRASPHSSPCALSPSASPLLWERGRG